MTHKYNPKLFEAFTDADKGNWIKIKMKPLDGVIWRPVNIQIDKKDEKKLTFETEILEGEGIPEVTDPVLFEKVCQDVIHSIIEEMMREESQ